jgi:hypothetical protein
MLTETITIPVDPEDAKAYREASDQDRKKLNLLLKMRLHDVLHPEGSIDEFMDEVSRKAQERGLTTQILTSILNKQ